MARRCSYWVKAFGGKYRCKGVPDEGFKLCAKHRARAVEMSRQWRESAKANGHCVQCSAPAVKSGTLCTKHREARRVGSAERLRKKGCSVCIIGAVGHVAIDHARFGWCTRCQEPRTDGNFCAAHGVEERARRVEVQTSEYAKNKRAGWCTACRRRPTKDGRSRCPPCLAKNLERQLAWERRRGARSQK